MFTCNEFEYFFSLKETIKEKEESLKEKDQKLTEAQKLESGVKTCQKAVERIRKEAVDDYGPRDSLLFCISFRRFSR